MFVHFSRIFQIKFVKCYEIEKFNKKLIFFKKLLDKAIFI